MRISKYNASGNDFVIFHTFKKSDRSELAKRLCERQNGVGADGLIVLLPYSNGDFCWEFYNSDGSLANMCGNGARAAAKYAFDNEICTQKAKFLTGAGEILADISGDLVEILLTKPKKFDNFNELGYSWNFYDTGVPHLVCFCDDMSEFSIEICRKLRQKYNANVNFAKFSDDILHVRTFERGVENETLACGTGMAASFCSYLDNFCSGFVNLEQKSLKVSPKSGEILELRCEKGEIYFKGKVNHCFDLILK